MNIIKFLILFSACAICAFATEETAPVITAPVINNTPSQNVTVGVNLFRLDINTKINDSLIVDDSLVFLGPSINYVYSIKDNNWYSMTHFSYAMSNSLYETTFNGKKTWQDIKDYSTFMNIEETIGYNYFINGFDITPCVGMGIYNINQLVYEEDFSEFLPYAFISGKVQKNISDQFNVGIELKLFQAFCAEKCLYSIAEDANSFGLAVSASLRWDLSQNWTLNLKPYFNKFAFGEKNHMLGSEFNIVFNF